MINFLKKIKENGKNWAYGKFPFLRLFLILYFIYIFFNHLLKPEYTSIFGGINLGIHELGHLLFYPFGEFISVLGGSLFQVLVPVLSFWIFLRQEDYFALSLSACWLGTSLFNLALYIGDAGEMALPLVSPFAGEEIIHDWNYLLSRAGLLSLDNFLSFIVKIFAIFFMLSGILWGIYLLKFMFSKKK